MVEHDDVFEISVVVEIMIRQTAVQNDFLGLLNTLSSAWHGDAGGPRTGGAGSSALRLSFRPPPHHTQGARSEWTTSAIVFTTPWRLFKVIFTIIVVLLSQAKAI